MKMNKELLIDNHKEFINLNMWINNIDFNNIDIIKCESLNLFFFIISLIEYKVIQCNILISHKNDRYYYYNDKHYFTKIRYVSDNNDICDILTDSEGNRLFWCEDKNNQWDDRKFNFYRDNHFIIEEVKESNLKITYNY